jgi:hypothetical protein
VFDVQVEVDGRPVIVGETDKVHVEAYLNVPVNVTVPPAYPSVVGVPFHEVIAGVGVDADAGADATSSTALNAIGATASNRFAVLVVNPDFMCQLLAC